MTSILYSGQTSGQKHKKKSQKSIKEKKVKETNMDTADEEFNPNTSYENTKNTEEITDSLKRPGKSADNGKHVTNGSRSGFYKKLNTILVILIVICSAVIVYRFFYDNESEPNGNGNGNGIPDVVLSIIPSREKGIINGHEHIENAELAERWTDAMDIAGISTTVMLGSPDATYWLHPTGRFEKYKDNNEELFKLVDKYPDRFIAFPTVYTYDDNKLELFKDYMRRGAIGLKLFSGHYASFHDYLGPLNHTTMDTLYDYLEQERIPIIWHVHLGIDQIRDEFEDVLTKHPNLIINIPHFGLSSIKLSRLEYFLDTYPNLYTDISFGYWARDGLWRLSNHSAFYSQKLIKYQDRFTYGTDMVCTKHPRKNVEWIANLTLGYRYILEKEYFNLTVKGDIEGDYNGEKPGEFSGLNLPETVLSKIYWDNMVKFLSGSYYYENLSDVLNSTELTIEGNEKTRNSSSEREYQQSNLELIGSFILAVAHRV